MRMEEAKWENFMEEVGIEKMEEELSEIYIMEDLYILPGERKVVSDSIVHIGANINCSGIMEFRNCVVYYGESEDKAQIFLRQESELIFESCKIICKGYNEKDFILGDCRKAFFYKCIFRDCTHFLTILKATEKVIVQNCHILDCFTEFMSICFQKDTVYEISDCIIEVNGIAKWASHVFQFWGDGNITMKNNMVFGNKYFFESFKRIYKNCHVFSLWYLDSGTKAEITNCSFFNISSCIIDMNMRKGVVIDYCSFKDCENIIDSSSHIGETRICNSYFENCVGAVSKQVGKGNLSECIFVNCTNTISAELGRLNLSGCMFLECYDRFITGGYEGTIIEGCEFVNTKYYTEENGFCGSCIALGQIVDGVINRIENCCFDGMELKDNFLITAKSAWKPGSRAAYVRNCRFMNCATQYKNGKIINYIALSIKEAIFNSIKISNCIGLDKINRENATASPEHVAAVKAKGQEIGSTINLEDIERCIYNDK